MDQVVNFSLFDKQYTCGICLARNSGQYINVTGLCNFFFVPQELIERILIFSESLFRGTCFLLASNTLHHKFFLMKISSLHWNGAAYTCI